MPINDDVFDVIQKMEEELGIPKLFYAALVVEDDWSFIIKLHSFLEVAVSFHLTKATGKSSLSAFFSKLDMSNTRTGKIVAAKSLGILSNESTKFIRKLSEIRNKFVHNISNVSSPLETYLGAVYTTIADLFEKFEQPYFTDIEKIKIRPKYAIWIGALLVLQEIYFAENDNPNLNIEGLIKNLNKNGNSKNKN